MALGSNLLLLATLALPHPVVLHRRFLTVIHLYHLSLLAAQAHLISQQLIFHRVLQGGIEQHLYRLTLHKAHFDNALTKSAVTMHLHDDCTFACFQFREFHTILFF